VARRKAKLEEVAESIKANHADVEVLVVPADMADSKNSPSLIVDKTIEKFGSKITTAYEVIWSFVYESKAD